MTSTTTAVTSAPMSGRIGPSTRTGPGAPAQRTVMAAKPRAKLTRPLKVHNGPTLETLKDAGRFIGAMPERDQGRKRMDAHGRASLRARPS